MMLGGFFCTRNSLVVLNIFYITVGIVLISLGAHWMTSNRVSSLPLIGGVVACGVFLLLVSIGGIYATFKHHQVLLFFYMVILFCLFIVQFSVALACLTVSQSSQEGFAKQGWSRLSFDVKETVQEAYQCCAFDRSDLNETDAKMPMGHPSCSKIDACNKCGEPECCTSEENCRCNSCSTEVMAVIAQAFRVTGAVSLFFSFTEFIGIWLTVRYRNQRNPYATANPSAFL